MAAFKRSGARISSVPPEIGRGMKFNKISYPHISYLLRDFYQLLFDCLGKLIFDPLRLGSHPLKEFGNGGNVVEKPC